MRNLIFFLIVLLISCKEPLEEPTVPIKECKDEKIDEVNKILQTREWDNSAKVWNHKISLKKQTNKTILYEDEIVIYGGMLTGFITSWAKSFYKHRQKRWQLVARNPTVMESDR